MCQQGTTRRLDRGWKADGGELVQHPDEQKTLQQMRRLRRGGKSYREIVTALQRADIAPRSGERWHPAAVARILNRDAKTRKP